MNKLLIGLLFISASVLSRQPQYSIGQHIIYMPPMEFSLECTGHAAIVGFGIVKSKDDVSYVINSYGENCPIVILKEEEIMRLDT